MTGDHESMNHHDAMAGFLGYDCGMPKTTHGGARPGAGRPTIDSDTPPVKYLIVVTAAQREKIDANGGAGWVRGLIDGVPPFAYYDQSSNTFHKTKDDAKRGATLLPLFLEINKPKKP